MVVIERNVMKKLFIYQNSFTRFPFGSCILPFPKKRNKNIQDSDG